MPDDQYTFQDPRTQYEPIDAPEQSQPEPGLDQRLVPHADHGEQSYRGSGRLTGRKALVTGGDSGIGRAAAIAFAREGADVALNYLPVEEPDAREVVELIESEGRKVVPLPGDITDRAFCRQLVADAVDGLGGLDLLANVAGKQQDVERLEDLPDDQFDQTVKANVYALFWITKAALPHLSGGQPIEKLPSFGEQSPIGRAGQPAELAPAYVYLASQESSYVSGETLNVNGGTPTP